MLGLAKEAQIASASSSAAPFSNVEVTTTSEIKGESTHDAALSADVPDLGVLGSLRADDGGQDDLVGRGVVSAFKANWGAHQRGLKGGD